MKLISRVKFRGARPAKKTPAEEYLNLDRG